MLEAETEKESPSWWKKRTCLEITLMILIVAMSFFILYGVAKTSMENISQATEDYPDFCVTEGCVKAAAELLANIDPDVHPCDDFYNFTCGNFAKFALSKSGIDDETFSSLSNTRYIVDRQVKSMYEEPIEKDEPRPFQMLKSFYNACMDTTSVNAQGKQALKRILEGLGGWPVLENQKWNEDDFDWVVTLYKSLKIGITPDAFFSFFITEDPTNSSKSILMLNQPQSYPLGIETMRKGLNDTAVQTYFDYMIELTTVFGASKSRAARAMRDVIDLEIELSKILMLPDEIVQDPYKNSPMTIAELGMVYRYVDWMIYINNMLYPVKMRQHDDVVIIGTPRYFQRLQKILENTPKRTLANYIFWKIVQSVSHFIDEDLRSMEADLLANVQNSSVTVPRWRHCLFIAERITVANNVLYARKFFSSESNSTINVIIEGIKEQFIKVIEEVEWMDQVTRQRALDKTEEIELSVNFPEEIFDDELLEEYYENFYINPNQYVEAVLNISLMQSQAEFKTLDEPASSEQWFLIGSPSQLSYVDILHGGGELGLTIPTSLLQGSVFDNERPYFMNFASIGFLLGERITHAFHTTDDGELLDWWEAKTRLAFQRKTQCILDEYEEIIGETELDVNDLITDLGAVKEAYLAYQKWFEDNASENQPLPGFDTDEYSPEQMFWISLGSTFCSVTDDEDDRLGNSNFETGSYYKINLLVKNSEQFAEDFKCSEKSNMNPKRKCTVW